MCANWRRPELPGRLVICPRGDERSFLDIETVFDRNKIQIELIKLAGGERLMRLTEPASGLTLERKLDPQPAVVRQKERLLDVLEAALARAELLAAWK